MKATADCPTASKLREFIPLHFISIYFSIVDVTNHTIEENVLDYGSPCTLCLLSNELLASSYVQKIIQDPSNYDFFIFSRYNNTKSHFLKLDTLETELQSVFYDEKFVMRSYEINFAQDHLYAIEYGTGKLKLNQFNSTDFSHIKRWDNTGYE